MAFLICALAPPPTPLRPRLLLSRTHADCPVSQATEAGQRLGRWKRREAALTVARSQREEALLDKSGSWVTWQTLDDRIAKALSAPEKMF